MVFRSVKSPRELPQIQNYSFKRPPPISNKWGAKIQSVSLGA